MGKDDGTSEDDDFGFFDRDDDLLDGHREGHRDDLGDSLDERRVDEDHLPDGSGAGTPDPGYAAYAEDLEDPLADWPSPETAGDDPAGSAPGEASTGATGTDREAIPEATPDAGPEPTEAPPESIEDELTAGAEDWPFGEALEAGGEADSGTDIDPAALKSGADDDFIDDFLSDLDDPEPDSAAGPGDAALDSAFDAAFDATGDASTDAESDEAPVTPPGTAPGSHAVSPEAVDDSDVSTSRDEGAAPLAEVGAAAAGGAAALAAGKSGSGRDYRKAGDDGARSATGEAIPDDDDHDSSSRLIPWAMVATVVLAVVLLGVGGYGVIKERSTLEANIRELQAQLATAVSSDEIAAEREQQRQLEREKQALESRLAALEAENAAMIETISALEARLESTSETVVSEPDEAVASAAPPAGDAPTRGAAGAAVAATGTGSGGWFVNFGSYARRADAERWAERLRVDAGEVVVQSTEASGRTLHRVRVNGLASRDSAERVATALEREYGLPRLWVGRN